MKVSLCATRPRLGNDVGSVQAGAPRAGVHSLACPPGRGLLQDLECRDARRENAKRSTSNAKRSTPNAERPKPGLYGRGDCQYQSVMSTITFREQDLFSSLKTKASSAFSKGKCWVTMVETSTRPEAARAMAAGYSLA